MQINPDITLLYQLGIFIFAMVVMSNLIFKPVLKLITRRKELTDQTKAEAQELQTKTEGMVADYEAQIKEAKTEGLNQKNQITQEGETQATEILSSSRKEVEASLQNQRQEIQAQAKVAREGLRSQVENLSQQMTEKLLGRKVGG